jgi:hypothetical protein
MMFGFSSIVSAQGADVMQSVATLQSEEVMLSAATLPQCLPFDFSLPISSTRGASEEVVLVQAFLKDIAGHSSLEVTGKFDDATVAAVISFQETYSQDILAPWGLTKGTGIVNMLTEKKMNEVVCGVTVALTAEKEAAFFAMANQPGGSNLDSIAFVNKGVVAGASTSVEGEIFAGEISATSTVIAATAPVDDIVATLEQENSSRGFSVFDAFNSTRGMTTLASAVFAVPHTQDAVMGLLFLVVLAVALYSLSQIFSWDMAIVFAIGAVIALAIVLLVGALFLVVPLFAGFVISYIFFHRKQVTKA